MTDRMPEYLKRGLDRGGKQRGDVEFNAWFWVAVNNDRKQAIEDARATVAFYGGAEQYEEYFAAHGFREEARKLQEGVRRGDYIGVKHLVPDEMAETFVVCGTADEVRKKLEPVWDVADSRDPGPAGVRVAAGQADGVRRRDREHVLRVGRDGPAVPGAGAKPRTGRARP